MHTYELEHEIIMENDPMKHIERIARVCYKSEDKIGEGTAVKMIKNLFKNKHYAMLEHYRFIIEIPDSVYKIIMENMDHTYIQMTRCEFRNRQRCVISGSARGFREMANLCDNNNPIKGLVNLVRQEIIMYIAKIYKCYELFGIEEMNYGHSFHMQTINNLRSEMSAEEWTKHGWMSVLFRCDRGITHELVRHRPASFAQESTRYCNYGGYDDGINFIDPQIRYHMSVSDEKMDAIMAEWVEAMKDAERHYNNLVKEFGVAPQDARSVLPQSTKADIVLTANVEEWLHVFELRAVGLTGKPHPMMQSMMKPLFTECINDWTICNSDDGNGLKIGGDWQYE